MSLDPDYDTPEVLAKYGTRFEVAAKGERWQFLTGPRPEMVRIAREIFRLPADENPNMHSTKVALVDTKGQIRGYYDAEDERNAGMNQLTSDIRGLLV